MNLDEYGIWTIVTYSNGKEYWFDGFFTEEIEAKKIRLFVKGRQKYSIANKIDENTILSLGHLKPFFLEEQ